MPVSRKQDSTGLLRKALIVVALYAVSAPVYAEVSGTNSPLPERRSAAHTAKKHTRKSDQAYLTEQSPLPVRVITSPEEAQYAAADKKNDKQTAYATLVATKIAAQASEEQAHWAKVSGVTSIVSTVASGASTVVALFGLVWVLKTFRETERTATAAVHATKAAKRQLKLATQEFVANNRPRLIVRSISILRQGDELKILYSIVNTGGAGCKLVDSLVLTEFVSQDTPIQNLRAYRNKSLTERTFAPGQYYDELYVPINDHIAYMVGGPFAGMFHGTLYFTGAFRYEDDLGNSRNAVFRRKYRDNGGFCRTDDPDHEFSD
jgi:hypothetical protein